MLKTNIKFDENDSTLVQSFHSQIQKSIVYIERTCLESQETYSGTGSVIGFQTNGDDGWLPIIVSAGHVLRKAPNAESRFKIQKFNWSDPAHPIARTLEFVTGGKEGRDPCTVTYDGPFNEIVDVGFIRGPKKCIDGDDFFEELIGGFPSSGTTGIETGWNYALEGTRVAWAGFPLISTIAAKRPQPCYFEGCVSSVILRDDYHLYLLDGHNASGVSGGPVWTIDSDNGRAKIIGVVSGYHSHKNSPELPGLVHVAPIQPIRVYLENHWKVKFSHPLADQSKEVSN